MSMSLVVLAAEIGPLAELKEWPEVQRKVQQLVGAMRGDDSMSEQEVAMLRHWTQRWVRLPHQTRAWLPGRVATNPIISAALYEYLTCGSLSWQMRGAVMRAWEEDHGSPAWFALFGA